MMTQRLRVPRLALVPLLLLAAGVAWGCNRMAQWQLPAEARAYFSAIAVNDVPLAQPQPGEWLYENQERGQSFYQYQQLRVAHPDSVRNTLYLLPIGRFSPLQRQVLTATREYLAVYFQLPVVLLPIESDTTVPATARRRGDIGQEQLLAPYFLQNRLAGHLPPDGLALMALTARDLYPKPEWNFVFGLASYPDRVGVTSLYRLQETHLTPRNYARCLTRLLSISSHELGHMLSLRHCTHALCVMNGTNSLRETDAHPNRLCSECQQKLYWTCRYNNRQRLQDLQAFFRTHHLTRDAHAAARDWQRLRPH